jgi:hypothetical protein
MYGAHLSPDLAMQHARQRIARLIQEADRDRLVRQARAARRQHRNDLALRARHGRTLERPAVATGPGPSSTTRRASSSSTS